MGAPWRGARRPGSGQRGGETPCCRRAGAFRGAGSLTVLAASHGRAEDDLVLLAVERVAVPIHRVVEKREVPTGGSSAWGQEALRLRRPALRPPPRDDAPDPLPCPSPTKPSAAPHPHPDPVHVQLNVRPWPHPDLAFLMPPCAPKSPTLEALGQRLAFPRSNPQTPGHRPRVGSTLQSPPHTLPCTSPRSYVTVGHPALTGD